MIQITFIEADGTDHVVFGRPGHSVMETAKRNGVPGIIAECGGNAACATCQVLIEPAWIDVVGPPNVMEAQLLDLIDSQPQSRLSCQIKLRDAHDGLAVRIPAEQEWANDTLKSG